MQLRNYQSSDLEALLVLWWDSWHSSARFRHPKPLVEWRSRWENILKHHSIMVVESDGALVGFARARQRASRFVSNFRGAGRQTPGHRAAII